MMFPVTQSLDWYKHLLDQSLHKTEQNYNQQQQKTKTLLTYAQTKLTETKAWYWRPT